MTDRNRNLSFSITGRSTGIFRAQVTAVGNHTISVKIPAKSGQNIYEDVPFYGNKPSVDDEIIVGLLNGDETTPVAIITSGSSSAVQGDIQGVSAGLGLSGGGNIGTVSLAFAPSELSSVTVATDDKVVIADTSDSDNPKHVTAQSIADLAPQGDITGVTAGLGIGGGGTTGTVEVTFAPSELSSVTVATDDKVVIADTSDSDNPKHVTAQSIADLASVSPAGSDTQVQFNNSGSFGASSNMVFDGTNLDIAGLKLGGTAVTSTATEINLLDGVTAGTISASKAVVADSNSDVATTGDLTAKTGGADGGIVLGQAYSTDYVGLRTAGMAEDSGDEYILISDGGNTYVSAGNNSDLYLRAGGNSSGHQIHLDHSNGNIYFSVDGSEELWLWNTGLAPRVNEGLKLGAQNYAWDIFYLGQGNTFSSGGYWTLRSRDSDRQVMELTSSERWKKDIVDLPLSEAYQILDARVIKYRGIDDDASVPLEVGLSAESLHNAGYEYAVRYDEGHWGETPRAIYYEYLTAPLIKIVKDLKDRIEALES